MKRGWIHGGGGVAVVVPHLLQQCGKLPRDLSVCRTHAFGFVEVGLVGTGQKVLFQLKPGEDNNLQLTFLDGQRKGITWGIQDNNTYKIDNKGNTTWASDWITEFNLPSYRFFLFLPFLLSEAELITYAGSKEIHGENYELVFATWEKWTPHKNADQYLIWINSDTKMIDYVQGTVRAIVGRSITALSFKDYQEVLGLKIPFSINAIADINELEKVMHQMKLLKVVSN